MTALPIKIVIPSHNKLFLWTYFQKKCQPKEKTIATTTKTNIQLIFSSLLIASALSTLESPANVIVKLVRDKH